MKPKIKTSPDLLLESPAHQAALAIGQLEHMQSWAYNVIDEFKSKSKTEIKSILKETAFPFAVCFENVIGDFNMATGIRNANAFNAEDIYYVGNKKFDKRGCTGVHNYSDVKWIPTMDEMLGLKEKYTFIAIDNVPGSIPIEQYKFPERPLFVFGEEGVGITPKTLSLCKDVVHISMFGSVRSLNVGVASGIVMFEFLNKYKMGII